LHFNALGMTLGALSFRVECGITGGRAMFGWFKTPKPVAERIFETCDGATVAIGRYALYKRDVKDTQAGAAVSSSWLDDYEWLLNDGTTTGGSEWVPLSGMPAGCHPLLPKEGGR
jgi:hypothetical protein